MKSILFFPDEAERLNNRVQSELEGHIFLFCNYDPFTVRLFSIDAKFQSGILNLYKVLIDSSIINGIIKNKGLGYWSKTDKKLINRLRDIRNRIQIYRSVIAHNQSGANCTDSDKQVFRQWIYGIIHKEPELAEDYTEPLNELEDMGSEIVEILDTFIDMSVKYKSMQLITEWTSMNIDYYIKGPTNKMIFIGQLKEIYRAKYPKNVITSYKIAIWFMKTCLYPETDNLDKYDKLLNGYSLVIDQSIRKKIEKKRNICLNSIHTKKARIEAELGCPTNSLDNDKYNYQKYYLDFLLKDKLILKAKEMEQTKKGSLLPQDVFQDIIKEEFLTTMTGL